MNIKSNCKNKIQQVPGMLPIEIIGRKKYFRDDRLREFRSVGDFTDVITFDDYLFGCALADNGKSGKSRRDII
jgi:hypothetical protein